MKSTGAGGAAAVLSSDIAVYFIGKTRRRPAGANPRRADSVYMFS